MDEELLWQLLATFGFLVAAGFGMHPIPEEVIVTGAGIATASLRGPWRWLMLPACIAGSVIADIVLYWGGRLFGSQLRKSKWIERLVPPAKREKTEANFHRHGVRILIFGRLVPGIRTTLFLTAGLMRLPLGRFILADLIGAIFGNTVFFLLGFFVGEAFRQYVEAVEKDLSVYKPVILMVVGLAVIGYIVYRVIRRPIPTGDPKEIPIIGHQVTAMLPSKGEEEPVSPEERSEEPVVRGDSRVSE
jgi:membrane protein DedA with SNARE-associated domain